jgi:hypothetical protein
MSPSVVRIELKCRTTLLVASKRLAIDRLRPAPLALERAARGYPGPATSPATLPI